MLNNSKEMVSIVYSEQADVSGASIGACVLFHELFEVFHSVYTLLIKRHCTCVLWCDNKNKLFLLLIFILYLYSCFAVTP